MSQRALPRLMLAAAASGAGKTTVTCGVLRALSRRSTRLAAFKCGPDYIDPMFHTPVIGVPSRNLDLFFTDPARTCALLAQSSASADLAVIEGVMGFYDGLAGKST
ncbi:MAG: cobyrinic acid a,c-diamide synthase, partial [Oscillospiraceae bacterium]